MSKLNPKTNKFLNDNLSQKKNSSNSQSLDPLDDFFSQIKSLANQDPPPMSEELKLFLTNHPQEMESSSPKASYNPIVTLDNKTVTSSFVLHAGKKITIAAAIVILALSVLNFNTIFPSSMRNPIFQVINSISPFTQTPQHKISNLRQNSKSNHKSNINNHLTPITSKSSSTSNKDSNAFNTTNAPIASNLHSSTQITTSTTVPKKEPSMTSSTTTTVPTTPTLPTPAVHTNISNTASNSVNNSLHSTTSAKSGILGTSANTATKSNPLGL